LHIRWRLGEDEVEATGGLVRVVVIFVDKAAVAGIAFEGVNGEVHAAAASGFVAIFDGVNVEDIVALAPVGVHEFGELPRRAGEIGRRYCLLGGGAVSGCSDPVDGIWGAVYFKAFQTSNLKD
jgi:hypothetical protein